ncbi:putative ABC transporter ATP-binding protein YxlF [Planctomycetes bacterium Poly30]|uniref:Putative ABC transporter ATP-binding protein YxlF n=1 Tax=Saltatorellus ferox TaxID=2528018 RepID=A0A518EPK1_9BACT|nr:putative ABC transporter ATP-binding protein YxlF [Planctomycetes bacterium Poly30]
MTSALEIRGITKQFGPTKAVDSVSFSLEPGEICGFIGPNGAGKTTTMRIISTLELPDSGDVFVDGVSVLAAAREVRSRLGFMPDSYGAYGATTVTEYLDFFARAHGLRGRVRSQTLASVMDFTSLHPLAGKHIDALSKGMKQRLCLAKTLLNDPKLLILDEPAAGLDPRARVELRELVSALGDTGKAVLLSSHILTELAEVCDSVAVIEAGRLQAKGRVDEMMRATRAQAEVTCRVLSDPAAGLRAIAEMPHVLGARLQGEAIVFAFAGSDADRASLLAELVRRGVQPVDFAARVTNLEDVFLSVTKGTLQ